MLYVWETLLRISCVELRERLQEPGGIKREVHRLPRDFPSFEELLIFTKTTILSNLKLRQTSPWDTQCAKQGRSRRSYFGAKSMHVLDLVQIEGAACTTCAFSDDRIAMRRSASYLPVPALLRSWVGVRL